jgi:2'-5' RNA ligase
MDVISHEIPFKKLYKEILAIVDPVLLDKTFPFVPHVSLGRLRSRAVVNFVSKFAGVSPHHNEIKIMIDKINMSLREVVATLPIHSKFTTAIAVKFIDLYDFYGKFVKKITLR